MYFPHVQFTTVPLKLWLIINKLDIHNLKVTCAFLLKKTMRDIIRIKHS